MNYCCLLVIICSLVLVVSVGVTWLVAGIATAFIGEVWKDEKSENLWFLRFAYTLLGYSTIFLPGYIVVKYVTSRNLHREGTGEDSQDHCHINLLLTFL